MLLVSNEDRREWRRCQRLSPPWRLNDTVHRVWQILRLGFAKDWIKKGKGGKVKTYRSEMGIKSFIIAGLVGMLIFAASGNSFACRMYAKLTFLAKNFPLLLFNHFHVDFRRIFCNSTKNRKIDIGPFEGFVKNSDTYFSVRFLNHLKSGSLGVIFEVSKNFTVFLIEPKNNLFQGDFMVLKL